MRTARYGVFYLPKHGGKAHLRSWVSGNAECQITVELRSEEIHIIGNTEIEKVPPMVCRKCLKINQKEGK